MHRILQTASLLAVVWSCHSSIKSQRSSLGAAAGSIELPTATTDSGATTATLSATAKKAQSFQVTNGAAAGTKVSFPIGSLAVDTTVSVDESVSLATLTACTAFGLGDALTAAGTAVAVQSSVATDPTTPFTLALSLPSSSGLQLADDFANLVVFYKVTVAADGKVVEGILPRSNLTVENNQAKVNAHYFGAYQTAYLKLPLTEEKKAETASPVQTKTEAAKLAAVVLSGRSPLIVAAGDGITLTGSNFRPSMRVALGSAKVADLNVVSSTQATFHTPSSLSPGLAKLTLEQDGTLAGASIVFRAASNLPLLSADESEVCAGTAYVALDGSTKNGSKKCAVPCTTSGQSGCTATAALAAIDLPTVAAASIKAGVTLAGVAGTYANATPDCAGDGASECAANGAYKPAATTALNAGNIRAGVTLGGVVGAYPSSTYRLPGVAGTTLPGLTAATAVGSYEWWSSDGTHYTGSINDAGTITPTAAGQSFAASVYRQFSVAGDVNLSAANIKSGTSVFGVTGNFPSATYPLPGSSGTDLSSLAAATSAGTYQWWESDGTRHVGTILNAGGGTITPGISSQSFSSGVYRTFTVSGDSNLTAAKIKSGVTIFGVNGAYPSVANPLPGSTTTALTSSSFLAQIASSSGFEYFDAAGVHYTGAGDANLTTTRVAAGVSIFGVTGANACTADGQSGCVATSRYKAADTNAVDAWDIRKGLTLAGISGSLPVYRNMAATTTFNRSGGSGGSAGVDPFDSIDDYNNGGAFPVSNASGWAAASGANWVRDPNSDTGAGGGSSSDGLCNGSEACVYIDKVTALFWSKDTGTPGDWESAIDHCVTTLGGGVVGGYADWRLPTQKELAQAAIDGIYAKNTALNLPTDLSNLWTATTAASTTTTAYTLELATMVQGSTVKTGSAPRHLCVRP